MPHHEVAAEAVHGGHGAFQVHQPPRLEVSQAGDAEGLGKQVKGDALTVQGVHRQAATVDGDGIPQGKFMAEWNNQRQSGSAVDGRKPFHGSCCFNESGKHKSKLRFRPLMAEAGEEDEHDGGGKSRPGKQPQGIDALEVLAQNGLPAGLGALAITVRPPPVTAPATTEYLTASGRLGTVDARKVTAALSLNAVSSVAPIMA